MGEFKASPLHDSSSHAADALRYLALGHRPTQPKKPPDRYWRAQRAQGRGDAGLVHVCLIGQTFAKMDTKLTERPPASAAERMRQSRERRCAGLRVVRPELYDREIDTLVSAGWLPEARRGKKDAVAREMLDHIGAAGSRLGRGIESAAANSRPCRLQRSQRLIVVIYLRATHASNSRAVPNSFAAKGGRANGERSWIRPAALA
jgi:hypothetical protein